jgi:hypothetical protein
VVVVASVRRADPLDDRHAYKGASTVTTAIVAGTTPVHSLHHSQFITLIERELESLYWSKTGERGGHVQLAGVVRDLIDPIDDL